MSQSVVSEYNNYGTKGSSTSPSDEKLYGLPLIHYFLKKQVVIDIENLRVRGKLLLYRFSKRNSEGEISVPELIIIEQPFRKVIVRGPYDSIKIAEARPEGSSSSAIQRYKKKINFKERR